MSSYTGALLPRFYVPRKAKLSFTHARHQASRLGDLQQSSSAALCMTCAGVLVPDAAPRGMLTGALYTPGSCPHAVLSTNHREQLVPCLITQIQPPSALQLTPTGWTGSSRYDRGPSGNLLPRLAGKKRSCSSDGSVHGFPLEAELTHGLQPSSTFISKTYLSQMEDITDIHLLEGKKYIYTITFFCQYFIAGVHILFFFLTKNSFHRKEKLLPLKQSDYTTSILQIYTNIGSQFLTSADKCLQVTLYQTNETKIIRHSKSKDKKHLLLAGTFFFFYMNTKTCIIDIHSACKVFTDSLSVCTHKKKCPVSPSYAFVTYSTGGTAQTTE